MDGQDTSGKTQNKEVHRWGKRARPLGKNTGVLSEYGRYMSRKAKVHLELNLARDIKDKMGFFKDISSRRKT